MVRKYCVDGARLFANRPHLMRHTQLDSPFESKKLFQSDVRLGSPGAIGVQVFRTKVTILQRGDSGVDFGFRSFFHHMVPGRCAQRSLRANFTICDDVGIVAVIFQKLHEQIRVLDFHDYFLLIWAKDFTVLLGALVLQSSV